MVALVERLAPLIARGVVLDLAAMRAALAALGDPQARLPVVHVAGTNGKGSVSAMVDAVLRAAGQRVGRYTSPHLHRFVERIAQSGESSRSSRWAKFCGSAAAAASTHAKLPPAALDSKLPNLDDRSPPNMARPLASMVLTKARNLGASSAAVGPWPK